MHLANWKAVDFCNDNKLNVFDLCLMKRERIPCQTLMVELQDGAMQPILIFDLDNYIDRAVNKKEEIMLARKEQERMEKLEEEAKSYFLPCPKRKTIM